MVGAGGKQDCRPRPHDSASFGRSPIGDSTVPAMNTLHEPDFLPTTPIGHSGAEARKWVSVDLAAAYFACSRRTLEKLNAEGAIPVMRVGRVLRVDLYGTEEILMGVRTDDGAAS